jgi:hypothetical protein
MVDGSVELWREMPNMFQLNIPTGDGPPTTFPLGVGDVLYVLAACRT